MNATSATTTTRTATMVSRKMDQDMITDITLDHLPDLSQQSVSFEIPNDNSSADFLLADATGFNTLCNTMDGDASFAPMAHLATYTNHRGPTMTLADFAPGAISQPSEIPQPPTLRRSPRKRRETPSRTLSQPRYIPSELPLLSEEPFDQLRANAPTLGRDHEEPSSTVDNDFVAHDGDLPVRGRKTPSRSRSKRRSQLVSEGHLDHLAEVNTLDQEQVTQHREDVDVVVHDVDASIKRRRTPSRANSKRSTRLVSEERLDLIPEVQTRDEDLKPKPREDEADLLAQHIDAVVKPRRTSSRSPSKRRSQLVSEDHLDQIPEAGIIGQELGMQPCEDVDVVAHDQAGSRKRSKTPSRSRSKQSARLVSEERLFPISEVQPLDRQLETQVHEDLDAAAHDQLVPVKIIEPSSWASSSHPEAPPFSEEPPRDQMTVGKAFHQALETQTDRDVVMVTHSMDGVDTEEAAIPTVPTSPKAILRRNPRTKAKPTVAAGGISKTLALPNARVSKKTKHKPSSVREVRPLPASTVVQASPPQSIVAIDAAKKRVPATCVDGDIDMTSRNSKFTPPSTGGMAERLVSYSQKLISSIGLYKSWSESFTANDSDADRVEAHVGTQPPATIPPPSTTAHDILRAQEDLLELSEISPPKLLSDGPPSSALLQDGWQRAMSPMRPPKKRRTMDIDLTSQEQEQSRRKKGKTVLASPDPERGSSEEVTNFIHDKPGHDAVLKSTVPTARTKYRPKLHVSPQPKGPMLRALPYMASSRQVHGTIRKGKGKCDDEQPKVSTVRPVSAVGSSSASLRARRGETAVVGKTFNSSRTRQRSGPISTVNSALVEKKPNATVTKPVAFTFRVDARLEARKIEEKLAASELGKTTEEGDVPDFKALHASHQASLAFRKENVVPSVPVVPFLFRTEQRAKEREKFDESVRRKEEEMYLLKEEERRLEAEEEERAIRELRRKAIPKANEVPEWYADMPKRKGTAV